MANANREESKFAVIDALKEGHTFDEQVNILLRKLQADASEIDKNRKMIYNDLSSALAPMFPLNQIHFFGSTITGLAVQDSDLDVYIANVKERNKPEFLTLKTIRMLIYKSKKFCDLLLISGAAVPIIKCIHAKTQICCDLNIKNKLSVANSELIKYYLSLDEKIQPLMIIVKFWADCLGLKKVNFLSGYAIYMLVIFYLQQEPYNLPSVYDLQKNIKADIEDGWNCAFASVNFDNSAIKNESLSQLTIGFFEFYSSFDYAMNIVCPYLGKCVKKINFIKPYDLPDSYKQYMSQNKEFKVTPGICIQDPFEHDRNVAASMPLLHVGRFAMLCDRTAQRVNEDEDNFLHKILTQVILGAANCNFSIQKSGDDSDEKNREWFQSVKCYTVEIMEKVFCCQVKQTGAKNEEIKFNCTGQYNIWENRINVLKGLQSVLPPESNELEKEIAVTSQITKHFPQALPISLFLQISLKKNPCRAEFVIRFTKKCKLCFHILYFLQNKIPKWFGLYKSEIKETRDETVTEQIDHTNIESEIPKIKDGSKELFEVQVTENQLTELQNESIIKKEDSPANENSIFEKAPIAVKTTPDEIEDMSIKEDQISDENNICQQDNPTGKQSAADDQSPEQKPALTEDQVDADPVDSADKTSDKCPSVTDVKPQEEGELLDEEDEEEEDVPADFFDDFSNQDFMDGLDIVDAWDDDSGKLLEADDAEADDSKQTKIDRKKAHSPIRFASKESSRKSSEKRPKRPYDKYARSKSRSPMRRRRRTRSRSRSREKLRVVDIRRDPEKTRRDINRDKIKCAKDKEQKLVTDKLKLVETGLVPPGTEMDTDPSTIIKEKKPPKEESMEKIRDLKPERERRYSRRSGSREGRKPTRYSRSPLVYRPKNKERPEPSYRPRRRTSSVDSNLSERELWIRSGRKRTRSRSRSRSRGSPPRLKSRKYEEKKKKTFLEEIREKLNEVRSVPLVQYSHSTMSTFPTPAQNVPHPIPVPHPVRAPHPIPVPVPAPSQFYPQPQNNAGIQQYDQSFFIGDSYPIGHSNVMMNQQPQNNNYNGMMGNAPRNLMSIPIVQMTQVAAVPPVQTTPKQPVVQRNASAAPKITVLSQTIIKPNEQQKQTNAKQATDDIDKLFADKKISLSDFLTITAKCEVQSASPEHLQKKIKVISRCQDAIRAMSDDRKFSGRLTVKAAPEQKNKSDIKFQSPLRRIPVVRFQFTTPVKMSEELDGFAVTLDKLLQKIGVLKETIDLDETPESFNKSSNSAFADEETLTLKASMLSSKTEQGGCEECKKRKLKVYTEVGSQCAETKETFSIGVQVTEEDLNPNKGLPKNDSIAYLTPAQLLGKEKEKEKDPVQTTAENTEKKVEVLGSKEVESKPQKNKNTFKGRGGGFRKSLRDRQYSNSSFEANDYELYERTSMGYEFENPRESYGPRFGMPSPLFPSRPLFDSSQSSMLRMGQLRDDGGSQFTDFNNTFRGRSPRFGPRY